MFYGTPIIYNVQMLPEKFRMIMNFNPMAHFVNAYRNIFLYKSRPEISSLIFIVCLSIIVLVIGYTVFKKLEKGFAEEV